jgi:hypothetical protein
MAKLMVLYGPPGGPAAFEDCYANRHIPYARGLASDDAAARPA